MTDKHDAFKEYVALLMKAHKLEEEFLEIPKEAARKSQKEGLLFTSEMRPLLIKKLNELKEAEIMRDQARKKFMDML